MRSVIAGTHHVLTVSLSPSRFPLKHVRARKWPGSARQAVRECATAQLRFR
jgi:hypothetical protein